MADLLIRVVTADGSPGEVRGRIRLDGDRLTGDGRTADDVIDMLRRRSRLPDSQLHERLSADGWSNGQLMLTQS